MKIQYLIEDLVNADIARKRFNGTLKRKDTGYALSGKQLSNGSQASVKADPNDPHMIKKHNTKVYPEKSIIQGFKPTRANDGFNDYIEYLINNNLTDNIHFPKVYNVKTIIDKNGDKIHTYTMERLIETDTLTVEQIEAFLENNLSEKWQDSVKWTSHPIEYVVRLITNCIQGTRDMDEIFTNKELISAISIIKQIKNTISAQIDLSVHNIMWRRTPYGMILVFTDPFF
jgi:hypothetical protein